MTIISFNTQTPGLQGVNPRTVQLVTTDNLATITAAGYMNKQGQVLEGMNLIPTDIINCIYSYVPATNSGTFIFLTPTISNGVITLVEFVNPGDVLLPVVSGDFAVFNGTTGQIKDAGYLPSNAAKTNVVMANGATIVNHIGTFTDVNGTLGEDAATAINGGNIQAGLPSIAGAFVSFPGTASKGSLVLAAVANTGNTLTTISNAAMGQASVITIPDPAGATANFVVAPAALVSGNLVKASGTAGLIVDQGVSMKVVKQAAVAGGAAAQTVTDAACAATSAVIGCWNDTSNAVTIQKIAAGNGSFVVTSSADPGSSHLSYVIYN